MDAAFTFGPNLVRRAFAPSVRISAGALGGTSRGCIMMGCKRGNEARRCKWIARNLVVVESVKAIESILGGEPQHAIWSLRHRKDGEGIGIDAQPMWSSVGCNSQRQRRNEKCPHVPLRSILADTKRIRVY